MRIEKKYQWAKIQYDGTTLVYPEKFDFESQAHEALLKSCKGEHAKRWMAKDLILLTVYNIVDK